MSFSKLKSCLNPSLGQKKIYDFTPGKASIKTVCDVCGEVLHIDTSAQDSVNLRYVQSPYQAYVEAMLGISNVS